MRSALKNVAGLDARSRLTGTRYILPRTVNAALEHVFAQPVDGVIVIENSLYARAHLGMCATTRPNRILLAIGGAEFVANPELLLHEYCHVVRQWRPGHLTRSRYLLESARRGYWDNRFEREARAFAASAEADYRRYLQQLTQ
jgi:hypothetical protein